MPCMGTFQGFKTVHAIFQGSKCVLFQKGKAK